MEECYVVFAYDDYRKYVDQQIIAVLRSEQAAKDLIAPLIHSSCQGQHQYVDITGNVFDQEIIPADYETFHDILTHYYKDHDEIDKSETLLRLSQEEFNQRKIEHESRMEKARKDLGMKKWHHRIAISRAPYVSS